MDDFEKTKEEFLRELEELCRRVAKVEGVEENTNARSCENHKREPIKYMRWIIAVWTVIVVGLLARDLAILKQATQKLALREAHAHFQKDEAFRFWSATQADFMYPLTSARLPTLIWHTSLNEKFI